MGLFSRRGKSRSETPAESVPTESADNGLGTAIDDADIGPLRPRDRGIGADDEARIATALAALTAAGVDTGDLDAIGAGYDAAYRTWAGAGRGREDHEPIVDRFAMGIGDYLTRHTDLRWRIVTDVFGTDLALADERDGDFVVVPGNLVTVRWMRGETGWIPGVVAHLVQVRGS